MHEVLVNRLGGLSLSRKNVVRLTDRPDMTLDVYRGRNTIQQQSRSKQTKATNDDSREDLLHNPTNRNQEPLLLLQYIINTTTEIKCFRM